MIVISLETSEIEVLYHARNPHFEDLPIEHAQFLVSRKDATTEELNILNNPLTRSNFNGMFRKIM